MALPARPSTPMPAALCARTTAAWVRPPKTPSAAPGPYPLRWSRYWSAATSQPWLPDFMTRLPSRGLP